MTKFIKATDNNNTCYIPEDMNEIYDITGERKPDGYWEQPCFFCGKHFNESDVSFNNTIPEKPSFFYMPPLQRSHVDCYIEHVVKKIKDVND